MAAHELELDALAQTGEQCRAVAGEDRLHQQLVFVDQPSSATLRESVTPPTHRPAPGSIQSDQVPVAGLRQADSIIS